MHFAPFGILALIFALPACSQRTGILPAGPDTHTVAEHRAPVLGARFGSSTCRHDRGERLLRTSVKGKFLSSSRDPNNRRSVSFRSRRNRISIAQAHRDIRRQRNRNLQLGLHLLGSQPKQRRTNPAGSQAAGMSRQHQVLSRSATILKLAGNQDQHRRIPSSPT
jgi:hypothetical protein